jgi:hypothetical protein
MKEQLNNLLCDHTDELVSYLFKEMPSDAIDHFETHLAACAECTEEFASLSEAHFAVYEWNKLEFVPMQTPEIEIAYEIRADRVSYYDRVFGGWSFIGAWVPAAGFALLAVISGLAYFAFIGGSAGSEIAGANNTARKPVVEKKTAATDAPEMEHSKTTDRDVSSGAPEDTARSTEFRGRVPAAVKISNGANTRSQTNRGTRTQTNKTGRDQNARQPLTRPAPRLNDFDDEQDDGLRLADLLAEIETSD